MINIDFFPTQNIDCFISYPKYEGYIMHSNRKNILPQIYIVLLFRSSIFMT